MNDGLERYTVTLSSKTERSLEEKKKYLLKEGVSERTITKFIDDIKASCNSLQTAPMRGKKDGMGHYSFGNGNYSIIFDVYVSAKLVIIDSIKFKGQN